MTSKDPSDKDKMQGRYGIPSQLATLSSIGFMMAGSVAAGYYFGSWLDGKFGSSPWLMIIFTVLGIVGSFIEMIRVIIRASKDN